MNRIISFVFFAGLCFGCASSRPLPSVPNFEVVISGLNTKESLQLRKYVLLSGVKDISSMDLQFQEFSHYIHMALEARGFMHVSDVDEAEVVIFLTYGIGNPQERQYSYSVPTYGQTGTSSSTKIGNTVFHWPRYGVTGYQTQTKTHTTYFRYILLDAWGLKAYRQSEEAVQIWKTEIASTGTSGDLRRVFPILVAASTPYISQDTGQQIVVKMTEDDERVIQLKK